MNLNLRLRHVEIVDFRKSEITHFTELAELQPKLTTPRPDDVVLFVSSSLRQLVFVYGFENIEGERRVLASIRLRLEVGAWSERLLRSYMARRGLGITGLPLLIEAFRAYQARREAAIQVRDRDRKRAERAESKRAA